jgi:hypothetical protein
MIKLVSIRNYDICGNCGHERYHHSKGFFFGQNCSGIDSCHGEITECGCPCFKFSHQDDSMAEFMAKELLNSIKTSRRLKK